MAAVSLSKINKTALAERRTHKKLVMIMNIMLAVATPLIWMVDSDVCALGIFLFCVGIGIGIIASVCVFRELTNSQMCDVKMSLPMSAKERYLSRLLTLGYIHIFPIMIYGLLAAIGGYFSAKAADGFGVSITQIAVIYLAMLSITFFIDSVTVLCTTCCGALAESVYFSIIAMGCISAAPWLVWYRIVSGMAGMDAEIPEFVKYWTFTSTLVVDYDEAVKGIVPGIVSIAISCLVMFAAYFIFRSRDASSVGDPIAKKFFYEAIMALGVFTVYSAFLCTNSMNIGVILTAVIYFVISIIVIRAKINIKRILKWALKLAATSAAFMVLVVVGFLTDGFGCYYYMPIRSMENNSVSIYAYYFNDIGDYEYSYNYEADADYDQLTDDQVRESVRIARKYGVIDKTFDRFIQTINGNNSYYNRWDDNDSDTITLRIAVYKEIKIKTRHDYYSVQEDSSDGNYYYTSIGMINQKIEVRKSDLPALFDELEDIGLRVNVNSDSYYRDLLYYDY